MTENADLAAGLRAVATRLRSEADIADRPGQMSRLMATAEQIAEAADALEAKPPTAPTREALRALGREHKLFRYQSRRKVGEGFSIDTDAEDAYLDAVLALLRIPTTPTRETLIDAMTEARWADRRERDDSLTHVLADAVLALLGQHPGGAS